MTEMENAHSLVPENAQIGADGVAADGMEFADDWSGGVRLQPGLQEGSVTFGGMQFPPKKWKLGASFSAPVGGLPAVRMAFSAQVKGGVEVGESTFALTHASTDTSRPGTADEHAEATHRFMVAGNTTASAEIGAAVEASVNAGLPGIAEANAGIDGTAKATANLGVNVSGSLEVTQPRHGDGPTLIDPDLALEADVSGGGALKVASSFFVGYQIMTYKGRFYSVKLAEKNVAKLQFGGLINAKAGQVEGRPALKKGKRIWESESDKETWIRFESDFGFSKAKVTPLDQATARSKAAAADLGALMHLTNQAGTTTGADRAPAAAPDSGSSATEPTSSTPDETAPATVQIDPAKTAAATARLKDIRTTGDPRGVADGIVVLLDRYEQNEQAWWREWEGRKELLRRGKDVRAKDLAEKAARPWYRRMQGDTDALKTWEEQEKASLERLREHGSQRTPLWRDLRSKVAAADLGALSHLTNADLGALRDLGALSHLTNADLGALRLTNQAGTTTGAERAPAAAPDSGSSATEPTPSTPDETAPATVQIDPAKRAAAIARLKDIRTTDGLRGVADGTVSALLDRYEQADQAWWREWEGRKELLKRGKDVRAKDLAEKAARPWYRRMQGDTDALKTWEEQEKASLERLREHASERTNLWLDLRRERLELAKRYQHLDSAKLARELSKAREELRASEQAGDEQLSVEWQKEQLRIEKRLRENDKEQQRLTDKLDRLEQTIGEEQLREIDNRRTQLEAEERWSREQEDTAKHELDRSEALYLSSRNLLAKYLVMKRQWESAAAAYGVAKDARKKAEKRLEEFERTDKLARAAKELREARVQYRNAVRRGTAIREEANARLFSLLEGLNPTQAAEMPSRKPTGEASEPVA